MEKKKKKQRFLIPFVGLKNGIHDYEFDVDSAFFEQFDYSIIKVANFKVQVEFEKKSNLFNLKFKLVGSIQSECDRCMDEVTVFAEGEQMLVVKFGEDDYNLNDEIKIISQGDYELDLTNEIYEYIHLLLPTKVQHESIEDCNAKVIEKLNELNNKTKSEGVDPRWAALTNLKDKSE